MDETTVALCIDLDQTLVRTDLLLESGLKAVKDRPVGAIAALFGLVQGRAHLKQRLAELAELRIDLLPYDPAVLALAQTAKAAGRPVVLATASNRKYAEQIALHLGIFDAVHASDATTNLSARQKAERLVGLYGERGFDYVGDARKDLAVWRHARRAIVVNPQPGVRSALARNDLPHELLRGYRQNLPGRYSCASLQERGAQRCRKVVGQRRSTRDSMRCCARSS
uniref:haloacid dehalogenase-like hydrolase n=1 Tax=uncultured Thiodictyon sp. TaxID=1846217 RepID=UPI00345ADB88